MFEHFWQGANFHSPGNNEWRLILSPEPQKSETQFNILVYIGLYYIRLYYIMILSPEPQKSEQNLVF